MLGACRAYPSVALRTQTHPSTNISAAWAASSGQCCRHRHHAGTFFRQYLPLRSSNGFTYTATDRARAVCDPRGSIRRGVRRSRASRYNGYWCLPAVINPGCLWQRLRLISHYSLLIPHLFSVKLASPS